MIAGRKTAAHTTSRHLRNDAIGHYSLQAIFPGHPEQAEAPVD